MQCFAVRKKNIYVLCFLGAVAAGCIVLSACNNGGSGSSGGDVQVAESASPEPSNSILDSQPPFVSTVTVIGSDSTAIELSWAAAKDDTTPAAELKYSVYISENGDIADVASARSKGQEATSGVAMTGVIVSGLKANTTYYLTVLVQDNAGNASVYAVAKAKTLSLPRPKIKSVKSSTANGNYSVGKDIKIEVEFDLEVKTTGLPFLQIGVGKNTPAKAPLTTSSDSKILKFIYTVAAGDTSPHLDYFSENALVLGSATINSKAGEAAMLTLPPKGSLKSLAGSSLIIIDTLAPDAPAVFIAKEGANNIKLTWTESAQATQYVVVRRAGSAVGGKLPIGSAYAAHAVLNDGSEVVAKVSATSLLDSGLQNLTSYHYAIFATDAANNYSNPVLAEATPFPVLWVPNGSVATMLADGNTVYVGGTFSRFGPYKGGAAVLKKSTGAEIRESPAQIFGKVRASAQAADGSWIIGGDFESVDDEERLHLARLSSDGALMDWKSDVDGAINTIVIVGNVVYVGGSFQTVGGISRANIAALDLISAEVLGFAPSINGPVQALAATTSHIYIGGDFSSAAGAAHQNLAAVNPDSTNVSGWSADTDDDVRSLLLVDETLFVGGRFSTIAGTSRPFFAAITAFDGSIKGAFDAQTDGAVLAMTVNDAELYIGGEFASLGGSARAFVGAVNLSDGTSTAWNPGADATVYALAVSSGLVYAGGEFSTFAGAARSHFAVVATADAALASLSPDPDGDVLTIAVSSTNIFLGGAFQSFGEHFDTGNIVALDLLTGAPKEDWAGVTNNSVRTMLLSNDLLYIGGDFTSANGQARTRLAALNPTTGATINGWSPTANATVQAMAINDGVIYVGGSFLQINSTAQARLARVDTSGNLLSWDHTTNGTVKTLLVWNDYLYVGGNFSALGLSTRSNFGVINLSATPTVVTACAAATNGTVDTIRVFSDVLYMGGAFSLVAGENHGGIAAMEPGSCQLVAAFQPSIDNSTVSDVNTFVLSNDILFAGGSFETVDSLNKVGLVGLTTEDGQVFEGNWDDLVKEGTVSVAMLHLGHLFIGGSFSGQKSPSRLGALSVSQP
jgi:hypothetical protein